MASEISVSVSANLNNGALKDNFSRSATIDQTTKAGAKFYVTIGQAAEEDISLGDLSFPARIFMVNLDATNFVKFGPKSAGSMVEVGRILAGGEPVGPIYVPAGVTLRMVADTADCDIIITAWEA